MLHVSSMICELHPGPGEESEDRINDVIFTEICLFCVVVMSIDLIFYSKCLNN